MDNQLGIDNVLAIEPTPEQESLIERVRGSDYTAFKQLFELHYVDLVRYAQTLVHSREIAEGLMQDLFVKIWLMGKDWHPQDALRAYLYAMAKNQCLSYMRRRRRREQLFQQWLLRRPAEPTVDSFELEHNELRHAARQAVDLMPERRRQIYQLSRNHGLTYPEIAALLGISVKTVEAQMGKALKFLRDRLAPFRSER